MADEQVLRRAALEAAARDLASGGMALTSREWQVLDLLAAGATNGEIALAVNLAEGTIRNVLGRLTARLGFDRTQLALLAARAGLGLDRRSFG